MLLDNIQVNSGYGGDGTTVKTYNLIGSPTVDSSLRRVPETAHTAPDELTISHRETKSGKVTYDQHLIRLDETHTDPVLGEVTLSSWMVIRVPRGTTVITDQKIKNQVGNLLVIEQGTGNLTKILNGES
jgi:hypothetical protein